MDVLISNFPALGSGFWLTFQLCLLSAIGALLLGTVAVILRISPIPPLRLLGTAYVTIFRNVPLTVVFAFTAFALPAITKVEFLKIPGLTAIFTRLGIDLPYFRFAIVALSVYTGAFVCEALRSGVNAVPAGQAEAARALGLTFGQNLRHVILPQAWKAAVVPLGSVIIAMIKNSAIAGFFGLVGDLSNRAFSLITTQGQPSIPILITVTGFYLAMTVPLGLALDRLERRRVRR